MCRQGPLNAALMPSRLLRIEKPQENLRVRLVHTSDLEVDKYAALSYSWGNIPNRPLVTTTRSNLDRMVIGIGSSQLPSTLEDAVTVCSRLGIHFIWIDSLCIIQDDENDWERESSKMSDVYQNAYVTIISALTSSCHDSFLQARRDGPMTLARIETGTARYLNVRYRIDRGHHRRCHEIYPGSSIDPIDTRAWTIQERALSTRCIVFTGMEAQWECQSSRACECELETEDTIGGFFRSGLDPKNILGPLHTWETLLIDYSRRNLTVDEDRLPALSAIARKLSSSIGSDYFAGLWRSSLIGGLCWEIWLGLTPVPDADANAVYFPGTYVAPSFSWASVIGEVTYTKERWGDLRWLATLVQCHIVTRTGDPFGRINNAYVELKAPLFMTAILPVQAGRNYDLQLDSMPVQHATFRIDGPIHTERLDGTSTSTVRRFRGSVKEYIMEANQSFTTVPIYFLALFSTENSTYDRFTTWGLLVGKVTAGNEYERIGSASLTATLSTLDQGVLSRHEQIVRLV
jgi:Heterokaryon incompatibility protein (HET)